MQDRLLDVRSLHTNFITGGGIVNAVRGIDLHVDKGEFLGIAGESGCGKSVSMLSIMRLLPENAAVKSEGIVFNGIDLQKKSRKYMRSIQGNQIGMIFQDPMTCLNPLYTIGNQLMEPLKIHRKLSAREARKRAAEMLELVGISSPERRLRQYPHEFSGGMRQRTMIAMAMCCDPQLLIADEPTTALDVTIQAQILDLMLNLKRQFDTSTVLITHDLGVIATVCTRVVIMYGGLVMESGSIEDIFYRPAHPYTIGLLQSVPGAGERTKEQLTPIPGSPPDLMNPPVGCPFVARCNYAMKICNLAHPELREVGKGHVSACWLCHPKASFMKGRLQ